MKETATLLSFERLAFQFAVVVVDMRTKLH